MTVYTKTKPKEIQMERGGVLATVLLFGAFSVSLELDGQRGLQVWEHR